MMMYLGCYSVNNANDCNLDPIVGEDKKELSGRVRKIAMEKVLPGCTGFWSVQDEQNQTVTCGRVRGKKLEKQPNISLQVRAYKKGNGVAILLRGKIAKAGEIANHCDLILTKTGNGIMVVPSKKDNNHKESAMVVNRELSKIRNGASLYLNADILSNSGLSAGSVVALTVEDGRIVIERKGEKVAEEKQKTECLF